MLHQDVKRRIDKNIRELQLCTVTERTLAATIENVANLQQMLGGASQGDYFSTVGIETESE
jgi:hypothetical protein